MTEASCLNYKIVNYRLFYENGEMVLYMMKM